MDTILSSPIHHAVIGTHPILTNILSRPNWIMIGMRIGQQAFADLTNGVRHVVDQYILSDFDVATSIIGIRSFRVSRRWTIPTANSRLNRKGFMTTSLKHELSHFLFWFYSLCIVLDLPHQICE
jgi:hypothetical protein